MSKSSQFVKKLFLHPSHLNLVEVNKLVPNKNHIKIQTKEKVSYLIKTIDEIGYLPTIVVDEKMTILDGHAVYMALQAMEFPMAFVIVVEGMSEKEKELFMHAACDTAHMIQWQESNIRNPWEVKHV